MDIKDKKIIYHLDRDSLQSLTKLAKKIGVRKEVVRYRLQNLIKSGAVRNTYIAIDITKLGYTYYKIYIKLHKVDSIKEEELIAFICKNDHVTWAASLEGSFDLAFTVVAKSVNEFDEIWKSINRKYGEFFRNHEIMIFTSSHEFSLDFFLDKQPNLGYDSLLFGGGHSTYKLSDKEKLVIELMNKSPRISVSSISKSSGIPPSAVRYIIKKLRREGIIKKFSILIDSSCMDDTYYKVRVPIKLRNFTDQDEKELFKHVKSHPFFTIYSSCIGKWDVELNVWTKNNKHYREIMRDLINNFSNIIEDYETLFVSKQYKCKYMT